MSAGQIIEELGLEQDIVVSRKEGNQVIYSLRDPVLIEVLDILKRYFYSHLSQTMSMLKEIRMEKITFALTVLADLTIAVEVGMGLSALLYIYRISQSTTVATVTKEYIEDGRPHILQDKDVPVYVTILRIHGPFLFGTTDLLAEETASLSKFTPIVILSIAKHDRD